MAKQFNAALIRAPPEHLELLDELCEATRIRKSVYLREALVLLLEKYNKLEKK